MFMHNAVDFFIYIFSYIIQKSMEIDFVFGFKTFYFVTKTACSNKIYSFSFTASTIFI